MSFIYIIQSAFELILIIAIVAGLLYEDKLAQWEGKLWQRFKRYAADAVKRGR